MINRYVSYDAFKHRADLIKRTTRKRPSLESLMSFFQNRDLLMDEFYTKWNAELDLRAKALKRLRDGKAIGMYPKWYDLDLMKRSEREKPELYTP